VAIQALLNARSNTALLRRLFPIVEQVTTFGMGDAEMVRDVVATPQNGVAFHVGGHMDVVVRTPVREVVEELAIGGSYARADGLVNVLRHDDTLAVDFTTGAGLTSGRPVRPGDVLAVTAGLPEAPFQFVIDDVRPHELRVRPRTPFSEATDEAAAPVTLSYAIGDNFPAFDNKTIATGSVSTSRTVSESNAVFLAGRPVYRVKRLEVRDPPPGLAPYYDPATGSLLFTDRVNHDPAAVTPGAPLQFRVDVLNPEAAQSGRAVTRVRLGWPGLSLDGYDVVVTYDTLSTFDTINTYVTDAENRPGAADTITRARHPVVLSVTVPYAVNSSPTPFRTTAEAAFDEAAAATSLATFVNAYRGTAVIDVSLLATEVRQAADTVAAVYPFAVEYQLLGPDGRVFKYDTTDRVTVFPDGTHGARLLNPGDFGLDPANYFAGLRALLQSFGVSDRNLCYLSSADEISFERRT
jgi:hypothetical protein